MCFFFRMSVIIKMAAMLYTGPIIYFVVAVVGSILVIELSKIIIKISVCQLCIIGMNSMWTVGACALFLMLEFLGGNVYARLCK